MADTGLENIEVAIENLVNGMTIAGGFNFDWGTSNEPDRALNDRFPNALIKRGIEENQDPLGSTHSQAYHNEVDFQIVVRGKQATITKFPNVSMDTEHNKALIDLKKLFGKRENQHLNDTANSILYRSSIPVLLKSGDIFGPSDLVTEWLVRYAQDRLDPTQPAN